MAPHFSPVTQSIKRKLHDSLHFVGQILSPMESISSCIRGNNKSPQEEYVDVITRQGPSTNSSPDKKTPCKSSKNRRSAEEADKFSAFLAKLEEQRQQVHSQLDPNEVFFVRFISSDNNQDFKPIAVKLDPKLALRTKNGDHKHESCKKAAASNDHGDGALSRKLPSPSCMSKGEKQGAWTTKKEKKGILRRLDQWDNPSFYLPVTFILILMFLVLFGRAFTIMCASIGWYALPSNTNNNVSNSWKFRGLSRKIAQKMIKEEGI